MAAASSFRARAKHIFKRSRASLRNVGARCVALGMCFQVSTELAHSHMMAFLSVLLCVGGDQRAGRQSTRWRLLSCGVPSVRDSTWSVRERLRPDLTGHLYVIPLAFVLHQHHALRALSAPQLCPPAFRHRRVTTERTTYRAARTGLPHSYI